MCNANGIGWQALSLGDLAKKTNNASIKSILTLMADSEAKHYNIILSMQRNGNTQYSTDTEVLSKIKNVFETMKEEMNVDVSQVEFYKKALEVETKSEKFSCSCVTAWYLG